MRALLDKLQATITDFIEQRDALWLRVGGSTADAPIVLKLLLSIERRNKGDVFLIYATRFANQEQYVDELTGLFRAEYQALQEERSARQHAPLQPLPERRWVAHFVRMDAGPCVARSAAYSGSRSIRS